MTTTLADSCVGKLLTFLKAKPRATKHGNRHYIDTGNNRELIRLPRHTVVFGRRGSGKTMLLSELSNSATKSGHSVIWIDIDDYKTLTFPDILIQVLRSVFRELAKDIKRRNSWWRHPIRRYAASGVIRRLKKEEEFLVELLQRFKEADMKVDEQSEVKDARAGRVGIKVAKTLEADFGRTRETENTQSRTESSLGRDRKIDRIGRHLHDAKELLTDAMAVIETTCYLVLDDFYHLTVSDQAEVLDYLQSLTKNTSVYIKFGTIAHRSNLYRRGAELIHGMQKEHDVVTVHTPGSSEGADC